MKYIKTFEGFDGAFNNGRYEYVYVTDVNGKKTRIYIEKKENGTYTIGCNSVGIRKEGIDEKSLNGEIEKLKKEIKKGK